MKNCEIDWGKTMNDRRTGKYRWKVYSGRWFIKQMVEIEIEVFVTKVNYLSRSTRRVTEWRSPTEEELDNCVIDWGEIKHGE
jgi:hypothetical protein